jgi:hypothetical protein
MNIEKRPDRGMWFSESLVQQPDEVVAGILAAAIAVKQPAFSVAM